MNISLVENHRGNFGEIVQQQLQKPVQQYALNPRNQRRLKKETQIGYCLTQEYKREEREDANGL